MVPIEKLAGLQEAVREATNGTARFEAGEQAWFAPVDGGIKIFG